MEKMRAYISLDPNSGKILNVYKKTELKCTVNKDYSIKTYKSTGFEQNYKRAIRIQQETDEIVGEVRHKEIKTYENLI